APLGYQSPTSPGPCARSGPTMQNVSPHVLQFAQQLGRKVQARALVVYADAVTRDDDLRRLLEGVEFPIILVTRSKGARVASGLASSTWVTIPEAAVNRASQFKSAVLVCLARGVLRPGDRVVFLGGAEGSGALDTAFVFNVGNLPE